MDEMRGKCGRDLLDNFAKLLRVERRNLQKPLNRSVGFNAATVLSN